MLIHQMTRDLSLDLLKSLHLGRLGCTQASQAYITPFSFAYDGNHLYSFATVGKKITWMRDNPRVCVEAGSIVNRGNWQTVVLEGRYEELPGSAEFLDRREYAHQLLAKTASWWDPGYTKTLQAAGTERPLEPVYFRISVDTISGHCCTPV